MLRCTLSLNLDMNETFTQCSLMFESHMFDHRLFTFSSFRSCLRHRLLLLTSLLIVYLFVQSYSKDQEDLQLQKEL